MAGYANLEINTFSVIMLLILFVNSHKRLGGYLPDQKLFLMMVAANILILICDSVQWLLDGTPGLAVYYAIRISTVLYYALQPVPCLLWCFYVRYAIKMDVQTMLKAKILLLVPCLINGVISILTYFYGFYFYVDALNVYHRGGLFWMSIALTYVYFVYAFIYLLYNKKNTERKIYYSLLLFSLPPMFGSIIQALYYGLALIWPGVALSLLIIFINIQKNQLYTDHVTGVYNRRLLDIHLQECLRNGKKSDTIGVIMLDIDQFKHINDRFGHVVGDQALMETAKLLKKSAEKTGFIARYGGDEFVIILSAKQIEQLEALVSVIEKNLANLNARRDQLYELSLSMGYEVFDCAGRVSKEEILKAVDRRMYDQKHRHCTQA